MHATVHYNSSALLRTSSPTKVRVLVERRYLSHAQPTGLVNALMSAGCAVETIESDSLAICIANSPISHNEVVVARGRDWPTFSLLRSAELKGARVINSTSAIASVFDKARMAVELAHAGIPTPHTWIGSTQAIAGSIHKDDFPILIKPVNGDNSRDIRLVHVAEELRQISGPVLAQHYIANDGFDLKLYCIGDDVWVVRKPGLSFGPNTTNVSSPELLALTPEWSALARRCRLCFGLEWFGVDCIRTPRGLVVIEVNEFPNYSGVPNASERLAEYVLATLSRGSSR